MYAILCNSDEGHGGTGRRLKSWLRRVLSRALRGWTGWGEINVGKRMGHDDFFVIFFSWKNTDFYRGRVSHARFLFLSVYRVSVVAANGWYRRCTGQVSLAKKKSSEDGIRTLRSLFL